MESLGSRIEEAEHTPAGRIDARLLGLACVLASDLMLLNAFSPQMAGAAAANAATPDIPFHVIELVAFFGGALICALVCLVLARVIRPRSTPRIPLLIVACALSAIGLGFVWVRGSMPPEQQVLTYALARGVPLGAANTLLLILWGRSYATLEPRRCLVHAALSYALGVTLSVVALELARLIGIGQPIVWTICQAAGCALLAIPPADQTTDQTTPLDASAAENALSTKAIARYLWMALIGQALFALLMGVLWRKYSLAIFHDAVLETIVAWVCALVILAIAYLGIRAKKSVGFGIIYRICIPLGAVLLVADPFLSLMGTGDMFVTSGVTWSACFMAFGAVSWVAVAQSARQGQRESDELFAFNRALWSLALVIGVMVGSYADTFGVKMILTTVLVAFLAAVFIAQFVVGRSVADEVRQTQTPANTDFETWVARTAAEHGLSERETTVFSYLAQGRGEGFIAEELVISPNTVKTHRKHIYRKLGVSSREELLDLVASSASEGSGPSQRT